MELLDTLIEMQPSIKRTFRTENALSILCAVFFYDTLVHKNCLVGTNENISVFICNSVDVFDLFY